MKPEDSLNPQNLRIVLILQGGSALGAYQAGAYQALHESGLWPDWVVGSSVGAINAALLAGNPGASRLQSLGAFWERVAQADAAEQARPPKAQRRSSVWRSAFDTVLRGVPGFFRPRPFGQFAAGQEVDPEEAGFYDTSELDASLAELVHFDHLNAPGAARITVNAMRVDSGELVAFDSARQVLSSAHVRAGCATPPGFAPVRIDRELYWDAGIYSHAALATVLDDAPHVDTLCFMVDLQAAAGGEPTTLGAVQTRQKVASFASRSRRLIEDYLRARRWLRRLRELQTLLPEQALADPRIGELSGLGGECTLHLVRLPYAGSDWNKAEKDVDFSPAAIRWRWQQGYADAQRAIAQAAWLEPVGDNAGLLVHELPVLARGRRVADERP